jgi:Recombinase
MRTYAIYEPHAAFVRDLFKRFKELNGNFARLWRECQGLRFPHFVGIKPIPHLALHQDDKGYMIKTPDGLRSILTNTAYLGWYWYTRNAVDEYGIEIMDDEGNHEKTRVLVSKKHHPAIIDEQTFMYAHDRVSAYTVSGERKEDRPKLERRTNTTQALLDGDFFTSNGLPIYVISKKHVYAARYGTTNELCVNITELDNAFQIALRLLLIIMERRAQEGLHDSLYEQLNTCQERQEERLKELRERLENVKAQIKRTEQDKDDASAIDDREQVRIELTRLKGLRASRDAIIQRIEREEHAVEELAESQSLLLTALRNWNALEWSQKCRFVRLLVTKLDLREASPHFVKLTAKLREPLTFTMTGYMYRAKGSHNAWTPEEQAILRRVYPGEKKLDILKALPTHSWDSIIHQAHRMGVSRYNASHTKDVSNTLTWDDLELIDYVGILSEQTVRWNLHSTQQDEVATPWEELTLELGEIESMDADLNDAIRRNDEERNPKDKEPCWR